LILVDALADLYDRGKWVCQSTTWSTNVSPIIQLGLGLQLCDISLDNLGPDLSVLESIFRSENISFLFLTHLIGLPAVSQQLLDLCSIYGVRLVEDCCESHGATYRGNKVGNFGEASTFSFYYGHHMTTIEGGMICTDNYDLYCKLLLRRSHGLLRELPKDNQQIVPDVNPLFTFVEPGYNVRGTEINAKLGLCQLPRLDEHIDQRNQNLRSFLSKLDGRYKTDYKLEGVSSFCLPIFCINTSLRDKVTDVLKSNNIEFRPLIGGNLYKHPFMKSINQFQYDSNSEIAHNNCVYVGNHQEVTLDDVDFLAGLLNKI